MLMEGEERDTLRRRYNGLSAEQIVNEVIAATRPQGGLGKRNKREEMPDQCSFQALPGSALESDSFGGLSRSQRHGCSSAGSSPQKRNS